jgi:hypothetical protein
MHGVLRLIVKAHTGNRIERKGKHEIHFNDELPEDGL